MASTINDKNKLTTAAATPAQSTPAAATQSPTAAASPYTGLAGLSDNTKQQLGTLGGGYTPSQNVTAAQQYLQSVVSGKPSDYQSQYKGQLENLYNQVMNRPAFTFDLNGDALYNQYKDQYTQQGRQAMMDTMGQAAAMTGGYGNSYAQTAGQQAYQDYLTQLNNIVPDLYNMAWNRYTQEGDELQNQLGITQGLEDSAYGKYRDTVADWNTERQHANDEYWNQYNADHSDYANKLNYWNTIAQQENSQYNTDRQMAYSQAMAILQTGKMPSTDLLTMAGISEADAKLLRDANKKSSGGGGSRRSSGGSSSSSSTAPTTTGNTYNYDQLVSQASKRNTGNSAADTSFVNAVTNSHAAGKITTAQAEKLIKSVQKGSSTYVKGSFTKSK